jgi:hypothetical protein
VRMGTWIRALSLAAPMLVAGGCCSHHIEVPPANIAPYGSDILLSDGQTLILRADAPIRLVGFPYRVVLFSCADASKDNAPEATNWVETVTAVCQDDLRKNQQKSWVTIRSSDNASTAAHGARAYVCVEPCEDLNEYRRVRLVSRDR